MRSVRIILSFAMALVAAAFWSSDSSAHAYLVRSEPNDGLVLSESPPEIRLWFDEPISGGFSSAQLIDPRGQPVEITSVRVDPADPRLLIVSIPELSPGGHSLLYKALSETDGHFSQGLLVFGVGEEADLSTARAIEEVPAELPLPEVGLRWLNFVILAGIVGAIAMAQLVFGRARTAADGNPVVNSVLHSARRRVISLAFAFSALGLAVGVGLLLWQILLLKATFTEEANAIAIGQQVLAGTQWGHGWILRQVNLLLLCPVLLTLARHSAPRGGPASVQAGAVLQNGASHNVTSRTSRRDAISWLLATALALALVAAQSLTSHASGLENETSLALLSDALHLLAASLWTGGLFALAFGLVPFLGRQRAEAHSIIKAGWKPFSIIAALSVSILFATGFYNTGRQVASIDAILTTSYGKTLMVKFVIVVIAGALGLLNSMLLHPRLAAPLARTFRRRAGWTPLPLRKLPILVVIEVSAGMLVMLITGMLTASPAPRGIEYTLAPEEIPGSLSQTVDDLVITLSAKPNQPGRNVFNVFTRSTRRPAPSEISRVMLRFDQLERSIGRATATAEQVASDRFILAGDYLKLGGEWQIQVVVRRLGLPDSVATFNWMVVPPGDIRPTVVSKEPIEPAMTFLAAALLLLVAVAGTLSWVASARGKGVPRLFDRSQEKDAGYEHRPVALRRYP